MTTDPESKEEADAVFADWLDVSARLIGEHYVLSRQVTELQTECTRQLLEIRELRAKVEELQDPSKVAKNIHKQLKRLIDEDWWNTHHPDTK